MCQSPSFCRSKSFGLFRLNFSKSGVGFSFGVPGVRIGVNAKGKKYVRGGIPGTGPNYQSSLPDAQPGEATTVCHPRNVSFRCERISSDVSKTIGFKWSRSLNPSRSTSRWQ